MDLKAIVVASSTFFLFACASLRAEPVNYANYAGPPIHELRYSGTLYRWEEIDEKSIVVWTKPNEALLLTLRANCPTLRMAKAVLIDNRGGARGRIVAGDSDLVAGGIGCRIDAIQPIDTARMKKEGRS